MNILSWLGGRAIGIQEILIGANWCKLEDDPLGLVKFKMDLLGHAVNKKFLGLAY